MVYIKIIICALFSITGIIMSFTLAEAQENIDELIDKGVENFKLERYDQALSYLDKALQIDPNNLRAQNAKGGVFVKIGKYEEALQYFENVLENDPYHLEALHNKIVVLGKLGRGDEATELIPRVLELNPEHIEALYSQGQLHVIKAEFEEALDFFDKALELDPEHIPSLNEKGHTLIRMEKFEESLPYFDRLLKLDPNHVEALVGKGAALSKTDQFWHGIIFFDKAFALEPNFPGIQYLRQLALNSMPYYDIEGSVKIITRDSNGKLVSYIEGRNVQFLNTTITRPLVFSEDFFKEVITKDGKDYKFYEIQLNYSWGGTIPIVVGTSSMSTQTENRTDYMVVYTDNHHGYFKQIGDFTTDLWTLLIPIS